MNVKKLLKNKSTGFYCSLAAVICTLVGLIVFINLKTVSVESTEIPSAVIALSVVTAILCLITAFKDMFKIPSLLAFTASMITFTVFLKGRVSYLAFYFSGDVMNTGLSPLFIVSCAAFLLSVVFATMAVCLKQEK